MAIADPRIHIICGICGCNKMMRFSYAPNFICDNEGEEHPSIVAKCRNCAALTDLSEIQEGVDMRKLPNEGEE